MKRITALNRPVTIILVAMFLNSLGFTIIIPVVPFLIGQYVDASQIGLIVGIITAAYALCQFLAAPVLGALSDQFGRRPILLLSLSGSVAGYLVFGIGGALWVLFLGRIIDGLTSGNISTMLAYVADITPPEERGRTFGLLGAASGFGFIIGPAIGGLAGHYSLAMPAFVAALVTFGNILWAFFALPETRVSHGDAERIAWRQLNPFAPLAHVYRSSTLVVALGVAFFFAFGASMWQSNISVFLKDVLAFGPGAIGVFLLVVGVMDIVSQGVLTGRLLPRFGERTLASAGLAINAAGFLLVAFVAFMPSMALLGAAVIGVTLGDGLVQPSLSGIIANAAPADAQGQVQGANQGQQAIARIMGPLLAAFLYTVTWSAPYVAGAAVVLIALAILFRLPRRAERAALA